MSLFYDLMNSLAVRDGLAGCDAPESWLQGRTVYGGLSAAISHEVAFSRLETPLPLRSAQIAFIGPSSGTLSLEATLLRQGRSVSYVSVDLTGSIGLATRTLFCFGKARPSSLIFRSCPMPAVVAPHQAAPFPSPDNAPQFMTHFDMRIAGGDKPVSHGTSALMRIWVRHKDNRAERAGRGGLMNALLALADALPPAIITNMPVLAPLSSMTWQVDILCHAPVLSPDGWWLLETQAQNAADGYSAQKMMLWAEDGTPVLAGRQAVAVFD